MQAFDNSPPNAVIWAGKAIPGDFARFAPRVFAYADKGDELALWVLKDTAADATMLIRRLLALGAPKVAMIGGVFPPLLKWLPDDVKPYLVSPERDAMDGAILMAERGLRGIGTGRP
jgi:glucosamine kinase